MQIPQRLSRIVAPSLVLASTKREGAAVYETMAGKEKNIVQELCESRGGRPGLSVLTSLLVSVDVKIY